MSTADAPLVQEARTFTRLLAGVPASDYVIRQYIKAHSVRPDLGRASGFERRLVADAAAGPVWARLADGYARRMSPRGVLRKKLVLLLAILETSPQVHRVIDSQSAGLSTAILQLFFAGSAGAVTAVGGLLVFGVLRLVRGDAEAPR
jgi:hypothetical protein